MVEEIRNRCDDVFVEHRPWGSFQQFSCNEATTVKIIEVLPGQRLSLQRHRDRAEMWMAIDNPLRAEVDGEIIEMQRGDLVWVGQGAVHRMSNPHDAPARVLELGYGHFDENDIERLEDDYSRA